MDRGWIEQGTKPCWFCCTAKYRAVHIAAHLVRRNTSVAVRQSETNAKETAVSKEGSTTDAYSHVLSSEEPLDG